MSHAYAVNTHEAIVDANKDFVSAFGKGDAAGVASLYTEKGQILPANVGVISGRELVRASIKSAKVSIRPHCPVNWWRTASGGIPISTTNFSTTSWNIGEATYAAQSEFCGRSIQI